LAAAAEAKGAEPAAESVQSAHAENYERARIEASRFGFASKRERLPVPAAAGVSRLGPRNL
jgi:hypothetical protein